MPKSCRQSQNRRWWNSFAPAVLVCIIAWLSIIAVGGVPGRPLHALATISMFTLAAASIAASCLVLILPTSNSLSLRGRQPFAGVDSADVSIDQKAGPLKQALIASREMEMRVGARFQSGECDMEDVLRALAIRLTAEIDLMRHEKAPRTWAESCRAATPTLNSS